jgi:hypothetical protein
LNLRKKEYLTLKPSFFRIIACFLSIFYFQSAFGQDNIVSTNLSNQLKKNAAIHSAKGYVENKFSNKEISKHFIADSTSSLILCDDYKTFFNSNLIDCTPVGFEIKFYVVLKREHSWDTLNSHLFLPMDNSFTVLAKILEVEWHNGFFEAWEKVFSNKYKFNYRNVLQFAQQKHLKNYWIDFSFVKKHKQNFTFYWFISDSRIMYRINPESGIMKKIKLKTIKALDEEIKY